MLKAINTSQTFAQLVETKCAEIFFRKENCFTIICSYCDLKTFHYEEYLLHFENVHLMPQKVSNNENFQDVVEIKIERKSYNEETTISSEGYKEFVSLSGLQEIPCFDPVNSNSSSDGNVKKEVDILEDNEWQSESETEYSNNEHSDHDPEFVPRILLGKSRKSDNFTEHTCKECSKSYKFAKNLERHIKKCHSDDSEYCCVRCKQRFSDERSLSDHQRKKHAGFPCEECDKVYSSKEALNIHRYNHTGVRGFHCKKEGCGKSFFNPKQLSMHTRYVHSLEKNFVCEVCGFRTKGQPALIVHKRSHTGEKPFICKLCGKGFASKSLLCEHEPSHSTERPHVCDVCGRAFARPKALYHHKHLHLGVKKFVCKLCGRAYAQMAGLAGHMRQHKMENC